MRKKFNFGRLSALALALTLITSCLMGGTLAKYTSKAEGTGKATVAKWKVAFKANDTNQSETFTFNLEDTGSNKDNVKDGVIAPESTGSIPIEIDASGSEVAAKLTYTIDKSSIGNVPIKFYSDASCTTEISWTDDNKFTNSKDISASVSGADAKLATTLYWKWASTDDAADTTLGSKETAETGTISITLSAEQAVTTTSTP